MLGCFIAVFFFRGAWRINVYIVNFITAIMEIGKVIVSFEMQNWVPVVHSTVYI